MRKKIGAGMLLTVLMAAGLSGCGLETVHSSPGNTADEAGEIIELTFYNADAQEDTWTDPVALALTEATGVRLKTDYPVSLEDDRISLMIAEQNYPDIIFAKDDAERLIKAGALLDLTELIEEYGPNIKKLYGEELDKLKYSKEDESIYQLSSSSVGGKEYEHSGTAQVQWDVLKANDYQIPQNITEYEAMLKKYLAENPMAEDGQENIGISISAGDWRWMITLGNPAGFIADGAPDNGQWLIDEDYHASYKFTSEKERAYFKWLNRMYWEGILDSEFATQTHDDYIAKISSGRVLSILDSDWDYQDAEKELKAAGKYGKTYAGLPLTIDEDTICTSLMYQGFTIGYGIGITTSCKDPVAAIKFLDYICSDEGQTLIFWGLEDVNYFVDENGHRYRTQEEIAHADSDKDYAKKTGVGFHIYPFPRYGDGVADAAGNTYTTKSKETVIAEYNIEEQAACKAWEVELLVDIFPQPEEFEIPKYSPVWAYTKPEEFDELEAGLDEIAWSYLVRCIIAPEEEFDSLYDEMLEKLYAAGMEEAEQMLTNMIKDKVSMVEE